MTEPSARPTFVTRAPREALALALSVAFGTLASMLTHLGRMARVDPAQVAFTVGLAAAAAFPLTFAASRIHEAARLRSSLVGPFALTVAMGASLGAASQAFLALRLEPWEKLWVFDLPLGSDRGGWIVFGALVGAIGAIGAFGLLAVGLRTLQRSSAVLDAEERLGIPALAAASVVSALWMAKLDPEELVPAAAIAGLGLGSLTVLALRDRARRGFVTRVFEGREPSVELMCLATPEERSGLPPIADIGFGDRVVVEKVEHVSYRTAARGRAVVLFAETLEETVAPLVARERVFARAALATMGLVGLRLVALVWVLR
jgi:hypothetical protein